MVDTLKRLEVEYDFVAIIDGLPSVEREKWKISSNLTRFLDSQGIERKLLLCEDRRMFDEKMKCLEALAKAGKKFCLHIVCHGNKEGIAINKSPTEMIEWEVFSERLQTINESMEQNLIINLTSCYGLHGIKIVNENSTINPFFGLVGPSQEIEFRRAIEINELYYSLQLNEREIQEIVREINKKYKEELIYCISADGYREIKNTIEKS